MSGEHNITITAMDLMGFVSEASVIVVIDAASPEVDIGGTSKYILIGELITFRGSASDDIEISTLELILPGDQVTDITSEYSITAGTWDYIWNTTGMNEGEYDIMVTVTDVVNKTATDAFTIKIISLDTDTDQDGMPDWWELLYEDLDPNEYDSDKDDDRDGITNLDEYLGDDGLPGNDDYSDPSDRRSTPQEKERGTTENSGDYTFVLIAVIILVVILVLVFMFFNVIKKKRPEQKKEETTPGKPTLIPTISAGTGTSAAGPKRPMPPMPPFPMMFTPPPPQGMMQMQMPFPPRGQGQGPVPGKGPSNASQQTQTPMQFPPPGFPPMPMPTMPSSPQPQIKAPLDRKLALPPAGKIEGVKKAD
jgi:hypothetical protein